MQQPIKPFEYENLEHDFKVPYRNYGKLDYEVFKEKYKKLTNAPKQLLQVRYTIEQW